MTNKTIRPIRPKMVSSGTDAPILSDSEIAMVLAMRSLPDSISKALIATTFSQADHYRQKRRPRFQVINGGQRLSCGGDAMNHRDQGNGPLGVIETDHADIILIVHASAMDHCRMRTNQLAALLRLISANGIDTFLGEDRTTKDGILWLASSLADEVQRMLPLVHIEASRQSIQSKDDDSMEVPR